MDKNPHRRVELLKGCIETCLSSSWTVVNLIKLLLVWSLTKLEVGVVGADVVAGAEQTLHHQGRAHGIVHTKVLWDATLLQAGTNIIFKLNSNRTAGKSFTPNASKTRPSLAWRLFFSLNRKSGWTGGHVSHQCIQLVANQGSFVDDVSLEDDEEKEESQHHVAQVAEDVVERAAEGNE